MDTTKFQEMAGAVTLIIPLILLAMKFVLLIEK